MNTIKCFKSYKKSEVNKKFINVSIVEKSQMYYLSKCDFIRKKCFYLQMKTFYFKKISIFRKK